MLNDAALIMNPIDQGHRGHVIDAGVQPDLHQEQNTALPCFR
jgi:hypothetical protein